MVPEIPAGLTGLTSTEARQRLSQGLSNDFKARSGRTYWDIFRDNIFNLFNIILFTLLLVVLIARDYPTVVFSGFTVVTNTFLGMIQEISAKRKLDQLAALTTQEVNVLRDGAVQTIPIRRVVLDDVLLIEPGDRIVVDGTIVHSDALELDESQLTGESDAVLKSADDPVYSGSFCIAGSGFMVATKVGKDSTINRLSVIAREYKNVLTPTQRRIAIIVELSVLVMFILGPMLLITGVVQEITPLSIVRNAVVFVTSLVPQGLVLVAILALTIGAVKISRHKTLIQRVNAVESLANVTVLCFDKTGTLTQNRLAVTEIIPLNGTAPDEIRTRLYQYASNLSHQNRTASAVATYVAKDRLPGRANAKLREVPFTSARKWGAIVFDDATYVLGAPERILHDPALQQQTSHLAASGLRVLAFAKMTAAPKTTQTSLNDQTHPLALIVMSDQIRDDIQTTLDDFRQLNVGLKVISGDNLETVQAIARAAGMPADRAYTGDELERLTDDELAGVVRQASVFARIEPDTKQRIVKALQQQGEYVAMVGDGVNDVPALKAANLAIVMNDGTQISKDVADIVLLNNAMSTLPLAFREGREITQTIFGTTKMFLTKNFYNLVMFLLIGFMMLPFPITPAQISWAAFGTVNMPAGIIAFGIVRPAYIRSFRRDVLDYILVAGSIGALAIAVLFGVVYFSTGYDLELARSSITLFICLFGMMIVWNVQGIEFFNPRSFIENRWVVIISSLATVLTMLTFYVVPGLFEFQPPDPRSPLVILIPALFLLTMVGINYSMNHRGFLTRLWSLVERDA